MSAFVYTGENEYLYIFLDDHHREILWWKDNHWKMRMNAQYIHEKWEIRVLTAPSELGLDDDPMQWYTIAISSTSNLKKHQVKILDELEKFQLDETQSQPPIIFQQLLENSH